jgi:uncharacterized tellurite resistance protein B-like protein
MKIKDFSEHQKQALLDLVTLAMYADSHLAAVEDERVLRLLGAMGFDNDYDRSKRYDDAVSRVSRHSQTAESARAYALEQAQAFPTDQQRRLVAEALDDMVTSDSNVASSENSFLSIVRAVFER